MFAHFIEDLIHLESGDDGFNQRSCLDGTLRDAEFALRHDEDVVPQARFKVRFHLRQIQVDAAAAHLKGLHIVEKVQREIEHRAGDGLAVECDVFFIQVPAARTRKQDARRIVEFVLFAVLLEADGAKIGIAQIDLAFNHVLPRRAIGIFKIGHEGVGAGVQRIDHHLAVSRPGNFHATILDVGRAGRHHPVAFADGFRFGQKIRKFTRVECLLARGSRGQQCLPRRLKLAGKLDKKSQCTGRQDLRKFGGDGRIDRETCGEALPAVHACSLVRRSGIGEWPVAAKNFRLYTNCITISKQ